MKPFEKRIFENLTYPEFEKLSIEIFNYQYLKNGVYREYCQHLNRLPDKIKTIEDIPFLPVSFFKTHPIKTGDFTPEIVFSSSATTGMFPSYHHVKKKSLYEQSFIKSFQHFYGHPSQYTFLALLPNYLEREGSSLIYMLEKLMEISNSEESGFYLYDHSLLYETLQSLQQKKKRTILFGVTFALLDYAEEYQHDFPELIVFETGGMKGRKKEMVKEELHAILKKGFHVESIHSEYGMCELLSQAYSQRENIFYPPPWMKMILRNEKDPLQVSSELDSGIINIVDLANLYSCSFIATDDIGRKREQGIEVLGRVDHAEVRGCNLLVL